MRNADQAGQFISPLAVGICTVGLILASFIPASRGAAEAAGRTVSHGRSDPALRAPDKVVDWRLEKTTGDAPSPRDGGKLVAVGNKLVAFGGFLECFDKTKCEHEYYNDVYTLDITTNKWEKKNPASRPDKRIFMGAAPYKKKRTAVFFAGSQYNVNVTSVHMYDDMWEYDPDSDTFTQRVYANQGPGGRLGSEIAIKDDMLYSFGGYDSTFKAHNDLWSYNLLTNTWQQLKKDDDPNSPSKRYIFRFELNESGQDIFIFGGNYREKFTIQRNDVWKYNIRSNTFTVIVSEKSANIGGRTHGAAAAFGDRFLIALGDKEAGGCNTNQASEQQNPTDEVWLLRLDGDQPLHVWSRVKIGFSPPPLKRVFYARVGDRLYVTLGFNFKCDKPGDAGPVYNRDTYSLPLSRLR
jgi:N-acetylneuraminic acid mutarotase